MGLRAYLMVNVKDTMSQGEFVNQLRELENIPGVDFCDPVIGSRDMVIVVDAPSTVESVANKIQSKPWVREVETLRIVSLYERHRASKKEILKSHTNALV
jgi:DNA-binding Lrp family transcriptional regulator